MYHSDDFYPPSIDDVLDDKMKFKPAALKALREFKRSKPWRGTQQERIAKFQKLILDLSAAYGVKPPEVDFSGVNEDGDSGSSYYSPVFRTIVLRGKISVTTTIHEMGHFLGRGEWGATKWSVNLFRRIWPKQFAKCRTEGHMLRRN